MKLYKIYVNDACIRLTDKYTKTSGTANETVTKFQDAAQLRALWEQMQTAPQDITVVHEDADALFDAFRSCFTLIDAAGGLLHNDAGEWLFILRWGRWDLPKGKREAGETPLENALREVSEECGLKQAPAAGRRLTDTYHTYLLHGTPVLKKTAWFAMSVPDGTPMAPQTEEAITCLKWFDPARLDEVMQNTYASIREVLQAAASAETTV